MTEALFAEGMMRPQELSPIHIVMLLQDEQAVRDALKEVPKATLQPLSLGAVDRHSAPARLEHGSSSS